MSIEPKKNSLQKEKIMPKKKEVDTARFFTRDEVGEHGFKVHVPNLIEEIVEKGLPPKEKGALIIPISVFKRYLASIADRCAEINDPILNKIMCDMAMYEQANPASKEYDPDMINEVYKRAKAYRKRKLKEKRDEA